jgi:hypothetical protein
MIYHGSTSSMQYIARKAMACLPCRNCCNSTAIIIATGVTVSSSCHAIAPVGHNHATTMRGNEDQGKAQREGIERPNKAKQYTSQMRPQKMQPSKAGKEAPRQCLRKKRNGEARPYGEGAREPGCDQTRKDDQGRLHPSPEPGQADHVAQNHAMLTRRCWKLWKWSAA